MSLKTILFILIIFIALTGCSQQTTPPANQDMGAVKGVATGTRSLWGNLDDQLADATVGDLTLGAKIMVMGKTNTDGSVSADRIIIGDLDFSRFMPPAGASGGARLFGDRPMDDRPASAGAGFFQPDARPRPDGQARGNWQPGAGGAPTDRQFQRSTSMARVSGEVLSLADNSLVIKLDDGGSKIVFFSEATVMKKGKES